MHKKTCFIIGLIKEIQWGVFACFLFLVERLRFETKRCVFMRSLRDLETCFLLSQSFSDVFPTLNSVLWNLSKCL